MIKLLHGGLLDANTYIVYNTESKDAMIVDFSCDPAIAVDFVKQNGLQIRYLVLTHGHYDHAEKLSAYQECFPDAITAAHEAEKCILTDPDANVSTLFSNPTVFPVPDLPLHEGDVLTLGEGASALSFRVLSTPGHTPGCISLFCEQTRQMLTGDTLFANGGFGRYDFKYGDIRLLSDSLHRLLSMDDDIRIYPGHGPASTIGDEAATLQYFS